MSDSGFTQFPQNPFGKASLQAQTGRGEKPERHLVRLIGISHELRTEARVQRLQGKITKMNDDGSVRVQTPRGEIILQARENSPPLRQGQSVTIEIPPGDPAREVVLTLPEQTQQPSQPSQPSLPEAVQIRSQSTPVNVTLEQAQAPSITLIPPPAPGQTLTPPTLPQLEPGLLARLVPIAPAILQTLPEPVMETLPNLMSLPPDFQAQIITAPESLPDLKNTAPLFHVPLQEPLPVSPESLRLSEPDRQTLLERQALFIAPPQSENTLPIKAAPFALPALLSAVPPPIERPPGALLFKPAFDPATKKPEIFFTPRNFDVRIEGLQPPAVKIVAPDEPLPQKAARMPERAAPESLILEASPSMLRAELAGLTAERFPVLTFPSLQSGGAPQSFVLPAPVDTLQIGTQISLSPAGFEPIITASLPSAPLAPALFTSPGSWPAMEEIYRALAQSAPAAAQSFTQIMPNFSAPPAQIGAAAMFFMAALRGGDLSHWLGEKNAEILRSAEKGSLLSRLSQEGGILSRLAEAPQGEWRVMSLPFFAEGEIHKLILSYRRDEDSAGDDPRGGKKAVRFIFDLSLSRMGKLQLDGLLKGAALRLTVRTQAPLSGAMQKQMRRAYISALEPTELSGELGFSSKAEGWVKIQLQNQTLSQNI